MNKNALSNLELSQFATQQYIFWKLAKGKTSNLKELGFLQNAAKEASIVSPYSSMIVLVEDWQKKMLKEAEEKSDRFDRDVETGKELLSSPKAPFEVSAVPEPEEWALIFITLCFLLYHMYKKGYRFQLSHGIIRY